MPFNRPTIQERIGSIEGDLATRLAVDAALLRRTNIGVLARVLGGAGHAIDGFIAWIADQVMPDTAELEHLERHAAIWGLSRKAATLAAGNLDLTGTDGVVVPKGAMLQRVSGEAYVTTAAATIAAGVATVAVIAEAVGAAGNADVGEPLTFVSPIPGIGSTAIVAAGGLAGAVDTEDDDDLRARVLARVRQPPHGGADFDYIAWAKATPAVDVTRVWVRPEWSGLGTVGVFFVLDDDPVSIIPDAAALADVQAHVETQRPVTAELFVVAPTPVALDFTIQLLPDTTEIRAAVDAELKDLIAREAEPGGTILLPHIREAVSIAAGENDHVVTVPSANVTHQPAEMAIAGTITWT